MGSSAVRALALAAGTVAGLAIPTAAFAAPDDRPDDNGTTTAEAHAGEHADERANLGAGAQEPQPAAQQGSEGQAAAEQQTVTPASEHDDEGTHPPGNNGTIKVDGEPFDEAGSPHPDNEPHVGCVFRIDFYGFDEGSDLFADVDFVAHPPTTGGEVPLLHDEVFIGHDSNAGGGSAEGWDATAEYDLTDALAAIEPHAQQGWHVKLTIQADGSQGAETKHKVFWVTECLPAVEVFEETTTTPTTAAAAVVEEQAPAAVLGVQVERAAEVAAPAPAAEVAGREQGQALPRTGAGIGALAALGAGLVLAGRAARRAARR